VQRRGRRCFIDVAALIDGVLFAAAAAVAAKEKSADK
jgi:hypothetical protein